MKIFNTSKVQQKINQANLLKALIYEDLVNISKQNNNSERLAVIARRFVFVCERLYYLQLCMIEVNF